MPFRINSNLEAFTAHRNLGLSASRAASSVEKLSSGLRITKAADDAAGLTISEKLRGQVRGLDRAVRNGQDGISMVQTAEGALHEVHGMLQRIRELAVQASNGALGPDEASAASAEMNALTAEINRTAQTTTFNGKQLLDGTLAVTGGGSAPASTLGGSAGANLVVGETINKLKTDPVVAGGSVTYGPNGLANVGGLTPVTATASAGITEGTLHIDTYDGVTGAMHGTMIIGGAGETFTGTMAALSGGAHSSMTMTGSLGNTIQIDYTQTASPTMAGETWDLYLSLFSFTSSAETISSINVASAAAGTYTLTSSGAGSLTLTGSGPGTPTQTIAVGDTAAGGSSTLNFNTLGISIGLTADSAAGGWLADQTIPRLLTGTNNTIIVNAGAGGGGGGASGGATFQVGADQGQTLTVDFANAQTTQYTGFDAALSAFATAATSGSGIVAAAQGVLTAAQSAIVAVSTQRGTFGAAQNRLERTIANLGVAGENTAAAESRIRDLDVASEMVNFTRFQILQQAGTAILAQANQAPQGILSLLR